jgi:phospho-N-acetylmuramoyl-pentapeptide-transferase
MINQWMTGIASFVLTFLAIPHFMNYFVKKKIGGQQMHEDVKQHAAKAGTPTMGGFVFVVVSLIVSLIVAVATGLLSKHFIIMWFVFAMYALVGFLDDFLKIFKQINQGLNAKQKLAAQIVTGVIAYVIYRTEANSDALNIFGFDLNLGILFAAFLVIWLVGWSNAVNLTDGIDGLASISMVISLAAYGVIAVHQGRYDILVMIVAVAASLLAFFYYNHKPAKIFMGDVGSLALGGLIAIISILLHVEWTLLFIGFVYAFETVTVMMQVTYFKLSGGKRIFRMTPIHHHFELGGFTGHGKPWSEWQVDFLWWGTTAVMSAIALILYFTVLN